MRTVTFSDPKVRETAERSFVCVWKNIRPGLEFRKELFEGAAGERIVKGLRPGTGATNICAHLATADGKVVHAVPGFAGPEAFLRELEFALEVARSLQGEAVEEDLKRMYGKRFQASLTDRDGERQPLTSTFSWLMRSPLPPLDPLLSAKVAGPPGK